MGETPHFESPTIFGRVLGVIVMGFGGWMYYEAHVTMAIVAAGAMFLFGAAMAVPESVQQAGKIVVGIGRSTGIIKTKPHKNPKLGETVSANLDDLPKPPQRNSRDS